MIINGNKIRLRNKKIADARNDFTWQKDPQLAELDATQTLTISFPQYLLDYASHLRFSSPYRNTYAVETFDSKHIGNCTFYDIDEIKGEAQVGIIIGDRNYWDKGYGTDIIMTLVDHIFLKTNLNRLYLKTLDWNARAQKCFKKCGFIPYDRLHQDGYNFILMELYRKQWEERCKVKEGGKTSV